MGVTGTSNAWLEGAHSSAADGKTGLGGTIAMLNLQNVHLSNLYYYLWVFLHASFMSVTQF